MSYNELKEYNGYTNYPTWVVELWIDNNRFDHDYWLEMARQHNSIYDLSAALKSNYEMVNPLGDDASVFSDLMTWALAYVNWDEIAKNYLDAITEEEE